VEHGAAGVVVSNHGGRQLDRAPAAIEALGEVVEAVAGQAEVYLDGGVRRGLDVVMALAIGARAVFVGRPVLYALSVGGEAAVKRALAIIRLETERTMVLLGAGAIRELTPHLVLPSR
jgi:isopentenyl diphosphate isomerase/L-lactate dehydrogenase-like FMN-dependent dehydrogenase